VSQAKSLLRCGGRTRGQNTRSLVRTGGSFKEGGKRGSEARVTISTRPKEEKSGSAEKVRPDGPLRLLKNPTKAKGKEKHRGPACRSRPQNREVLKASNEGVRIGGTKSKERPGTNNPLRPPAETETSEKK